jgi:hypothetical protein
MASARLHQPAGSPNAANFSHRAQLEQLSRPGLSKISGKVLCRALRRSSIRTPSVGSDRCQSAGVFRRRCPSSLSLLPRAASYGFELFGGNCRPRDELALPQIRVARVSRLIGKSDTTAKAACWQGEFVDRRNSIVTLQRVATRPAALQKHPKRTKRHSIEWRFAVLHRSLASLSGREAMVCPSRNCRLFRLGLPFSRAARWR